MLHECFGGGNCASAAMGLIQRDRDRNAPAPPRAWAFFTAKTIRELALVNCSAAPLHRAWNVCSIYQLWITTAKHNITQLLHRDLCLTEVTWGFTQTRRFLGCRGEKKRAELLSWINTDHLSSRSKEPIIFTMGPHIFLRWKHIYILKYMIQRNHIFMIYSWYT